MGLDETNLNEITQSQKWEHGTYSLIYGFYTRAKDHKPKPQNERGTRTLGGF